MQISGPPRISEEGFAYILRALNSPAAPVATACYRAIQAYNLDPAVGLAFFKHESGAGRAGAAAYTHNWGNIRAGGTWLGHHDGSNGTWLVYRQRAGEQPADHWVRSAADWAQLLRELYLAKWHLDDVGQALKKYAPTEDQNDPASYAACVIRDVELWARLYPPEDEIVDDPVTRAEFIALRVRVDQLALRLDPAVTVMSPPTYGPAVTAGSPEELRL